MSHFVLLFGVASIYGRHQSQAIIILHSSDSLSDCSFYNWSSEYGGAANIQSSNVALCGNFMLHNNIGHDGEAVYPNKRFETSTITH